MKKRLSIVMLAIYIFSSVIIPVNADTNWKVRRVSKSKSIVRYISWQKRKRLWKVR